MLAALAGIGWVVSKWLKQLDTRLNNMEATLRQLVQASVNTK